MADENNPGQFGNRSDTEEQASKGGKSHGKGDNSDDRSKISGSKGEDTRSENETDMEDK